MTGFEQMPDQNGFQAGGAIGAVSLGMPMLRMGNNPFMQPPEDTSWQRPDEWQDFSLCKETDPEMFFPEKGGSTREAKKVCVSCEVRSECLEDALAHDDRFGIKGGYSERERRKLKKQRGLS